jgi:hypothetical protein
VVLFAHHLLIASKTKMRNVVSSADVASSMQKKKARYYNKQSK